MKKNESVIVVKDWQNNTVEAKISFHCVELIWKTAGRFGGGKYELNEQTILGVVNLLERLRSGLVCIADVSNYLESKEAKERMKKDNN